MSDTEHCSVRSRAAPIFDINSLDLGNCHSLEINTALNEFELKHPNMAQRFLTWPPAVQHRLNVETDKWVAAHPERIVRMISTALYQGVACVILHHDEK